MNKNPKVLTRHCLAFLAAMSATLSAGAQETPAHVVVVIEENHSYDEIIGNATEAPFINQLASEGAIFTESHAIEHPSQPNYLDIFSGDNQGVVGDTISSSTPLTTANLGAELGAVGKTFAIYSETLPSVGYLTNSYTDDFRLNEYERKHNPMSNWQNDTNPSANQLPSSENQPFSAFPQTNFDSLPTVSFVVPNEQHDIHDGTITQGDNFLQANLQAYATWAMTHNSLLIITFDENDDEDGDNDAPELASNQIPTIVLGQNVVAGNYNEVITHYNLLQTLQDFYGTGHAGATGLASGAANPGITPITDIFAGATQPLVSYLQFAVAGYTVNMDIGTVTVSVQRVGSGLGAASAHFGTKPGSGLNAARSGTNYDDTVGTLSWADGDMSSKTFDVKIRDRHQSNGGQRAFYVRLSSATGASLGFPRKAKVTIKEKNTPSAP